MKSWRKILAFLMLSGGILCKAQQLRFKHITSEEGLSTNLVRCILKDDKGFMWFGTQDGLNKYDGYSIRVFKNDPTNSRSLPGSDITALKQLNNGELVVATTNGPCIFNPVTETFKRSAKNPAIDLGKLNTFYEPDSKTLLAGGTGGLYLLDTDSLGWKSTLLPEGTEVLCIASLGNQVYFGTNEKGLWKLPTTGKPEKVKLTNPRRLNINIDAIRSVSDICEFNGHVYLSTLGSGILKLNRALEVEEVYSFRSIDDNTAYVKNFNIKNDKLYAATAHGVVVLDLRNGHTQNYHRQSSPFSINANGCTAIYLDEATDCWVATEIGGVNVAFSRSLKFPVSYSGYETAFNDVFSLYEMEPGHLLVGGVKTFHEVDLENGKITDHSSFLGNATALCVARESKNVFWVGSWGNGIYRHDMVKNTTKTILNNEIGGTIVCLNQVGEDIYAGSIGDGLFKINTRSLDITRFTEKDGLPSPSVNTLFRDSRGRVWLGTYEGGLVQMSGYDANGKLPIARVFTNKGKTGDIASNTIHAINEDSNGVIWVATNTGLSKLLPDGTFRNYYERDGLSNAFLYSLLKDSVGHFWMSSNAGITRFNPLLPENEIIFKNYEVKDGLVNKEYYMGAAFLSPQGMMYFGGAKGFNVFRPGGIKDNLRAPEAYVIGYKRGGKDVVTDSLPIYKKHLRLNWRENYFQFELVALDYTDPAKNKFSYILEGYDAEWSTPGTVRYVSYTELPGGEYTFKVKAANNDGTWSEKPFEMRITVVPPFWKTKLFYLSFVLLGLLGIYGFTQYRTRSIKKENKLLEARVAERTRELHEKNLDITSSIEYAKRIQEAILPSQDHIFKHLKRAFILYKPKDIVSGDFYWFAEKNGFRVFAVVDCTGHGVPGAFMSMIGHNLLNQIVLENGVTDPGEILNQLHKGVQAALRQGHNEISTNDGMDVSMLGMNIQTGDICWAGANRPLVLIGPDNEFARLDGDKFPVGGAQSHVNRVFTTHKVQAPHGTMVYLFSDGYADQFGGEKGKKFMVKKLHELLQSIYALPADEQQKELENSFLNWKGNQEQVDDVLVAGLEI